MQKVRQFNMNKKIIKIAALPICICLLFSGCSTVGSILGTEKDTIEYKIENGEATVVSVPNASSVDKIVIPDEYEDVPVTKIADFAAVNLEYVTAFVIGKNVKEIGTWALENNQNIAAYTVDEANEYFCSFDGVLYTKDMKTIVCFPPAKEGAFEIPYGVETIRTKAFYKCTKLTSVVMPDSVKSIEEKAFFRCSAVTELTLSKNVSFIGKDAFAFCSGITELIIPQTIKQIDEYAFYNCTNLLTIHVDAKESDLILGDKWYPTTNGLAIKELQINYKD